MTNTIEKDPIDGFAKNADEFMDTILGVDMRVINALFCFTDIFFSGFEGNGIRFEPNEHGKVRMVANLDGRHVLKYDEPKLKWPADFKPFQIEKYYQETMNMVHRHHSAGYDGIVLGQFKQNDDGMDQLSIVTEGHGHFIIGIQTDCKHPELNYKPVDFEKLDFEVLGGGDNGFILSTITMDLFSKISDIFNVHFATVFEERSNKFAKIKFDLAPVEGEDPESSHRILKNFTCYVPFCKPIVRSAVDDE